MRGRHPYICHTSYNKKNITGYILLFLLRHLCIKLKGQSYYTHQASICKSENSGILLVNVYGIYIYIYILSWNMKQFFFIFFLKQNFYVSIQSQQEDKTNLVRKMSGEIYLKNFLLSFGVLLGSTQWR